MNVIDLTQIDAELSADHLKQGSVFGALTSEAIDYLLQQGKLYQIKQGDVIFRHGEKGDNFFIILKGEVDYFKQHQNSTALTRSIGFGEAIGFVSMIALHDRVGKAVATQNGILLEVSSQLFSDLHDHYPFDFGILLLNLSREMARTIRALGNALVKKEVQHD